jgi:hypothetical protein
MTPEWIGRGKTVAQLIQELRSFEDQSLEVRISFDGGESSQPISLVTKKGEYAVLENHQDTPTIVRHGG